MRQLIIIAIIVCLFLGAGYGEAEKNTPQSSANRLQPSDLEYLGAFRLPAGQSDVKTWAWGGFALAYYPGGDPNGAADGYPGSLFGTGHAWEYQVSEISIPVPVISASKNLGDLNTASTLQGFQDIFDVGNLEIPRVGLAYLPKQGSQSSGKLYFCTGQHMEEENTLTHGWFDLNLANPGVKGKWYLDCPYYINNTNDYMLAIPSAWAASYTAGKLLGTGRYRDGGWSGQGPALHAAGPWNQGNPPANGTSLQYTTLLLYTSTLDSDSWDDATNHTMNNYHHSDEWSGAAWLTAGNKSAVIFVGTKGTGDCWYGDSSGPCTDCAGERGWWSTGFEGQFIFYDPDDLAKVAAGTMQPWEPQPYASLDVDQYLYHITSGQQWYHLGAACFDSANGYLYVFEPYVDGDKPIIHVWKVKGSGGGGGDDDGPRPEIDVNRDQLTFAASGSHVYTGSQTLSIDNSGAGTLNWSIVDNAGWLSASPASGTGSAVVTVSVNPSGLSAGKYYGTLTISDANASNSPAYVTVTLEVHGSGSGSPPFGDFATPLDGAAVRGSIPVTGWVLDDIGVESVKIYRYDGGTPVYIGDAVFVEGARPDVEKAYPNYPFNSTAGWGYMMLTNFLPGQGNGTVVIFAEAVDKEGNRVTLGTKTINCDNANAIKPFGAIDTPAQGGGASGDSFVNWGWVLTPKPNYIPTDGSSIDVYVDGVNIGHPVYNIYRADIAGLFPGYANSSGAVGYFYLDTTAYENGVHTIQWTAADSDGNNDGIGSRYFTIQNSSQRTTGNIHGTTFTTKKRDARFRIRQPIASIPTDYHTPIRLDKRRTIYPDGRGEINIAVKELERLEIDFPGCEGAIRNITPLPIGSTLDMERSIFYWHPGAGFVGEYRLIFVEKTGGGWIKRNIKINILPLN
jgi:hypothetical protein